MIGDDGLEGREFADPDADRERHWPIVLLNKYPAYFTAHMHPGRWSPECPRCWPGPETDKSPLVRRPMCVSRGSLSRGG